MSYIPVGFTEEQEGELLSSQRALKAQIQKMMELQRAEEHSRRVALFIGAAGALFAAVRLGVIALPKIQQRRQQRQLGTFGE